MYKSLNDCQLFPKGETKIWYVKPDLMRKSLMLIGLTDINQLINIKDLAATHILLGQTSLTDEDEIYGNLQGEVWSPNGEAKELIQSLGLNHTSMCTGDIIQEGDRIIICDFIGWIILKA